GRGDRRYRAVPDFASRARDQWRTHSGDARQYELGALCRPVARWAVRDKMAGPSTGFALFEHHPALQHGPGRAPPLRPLRCKGATVMAMPSLFKNRLSLPAIGSPMFIISQPDLVIA